MSSPEMRKEASVGRGARGRMEKARIAGTGGRAGCREPVVGPGQAQAVRFVQAQAI